MQLHVYSRIPYVNNPSFVKSWYLQGTAIRERIQERLRGQQRGLLQNGKDDDDENEEYYDDEDDYDDDDDNDEEYYYDDEEYFDEKDEEVEKNDKKKEGDNRDKKQVSFTWLVSLQSGSWFGYSSVGTCIMCGI